jgi:patatin-like phospholipase/acyl hydrolase
MQLRDGTEQMLDPEGIEYADIDELRKKVLIAVRDLISGDVQGGLIDLRFRIDAEDREGVIVYTLGFAEAVRIVPDDT